MSRRDLPPPKTPPALPPPAAPGEGEGEREETAGEQRGERHYPDRWKLLGLPRPSPEGEPCNSETLTLLTHVATVGETIDPIYGMLLAAEKEARALMDALHTVGEPDHERVARDIAARLHAARHLLLRADHRAARKNGAS